jgi:hypothetical protein
MARKKQKTTSSPAKEGTEKKTSRRTFGKQLGAAVAAIPVAKALSTSGTSAKASGRSTAGPALLEGRQWNGAERYKAIVPALGTVMRYLQEMEESMEYAPAPEEVYYRPAAIQREIDKAVAAAAEASGATVDQISNWIDAFASYGKPGLMADIPISASDCAASINGTWELMSRFSGGSEAACRSQIYNDMDPDTASGRQLNTMWTEVNFFEPDGNTIFFISLCDIQFTQNGPYEVIGSSKGIIYGNFPGYEEGVRTTDVFRLVRRGQNESMLGYPQRTQAGGSDSAARTLVEVGGDAGRIKYKMWGSRATREHPRTMDTVDTYHIMSNRRPLVGGWEPIGDYFERVAKQTSSRMNSMERGRELLLGACKDIPIPRGAR